jgi:DNA replication protein DnaC
MEIKQSLKTVLKRLKLSGLLATLPDRMAYARKTKLTELDFLELVLQDEIDRRDQKNLDVRLCRAGFEEERTLEAFDWDAPVTFDRDRVKDLFNLAFIERREDVALLGPVGVGKTFLACALGHAACRAGHNVLFLRADHMFQALHQSRADHSTEKMFRRSSTATTCQSTRSRPWTWAMPSTSGAGWRPPARAIATSSRSPTT